ncbi:hypothetical protein SAURM35S_03850 [Streptomyces aurantiogriseus]
MSRIAAARYRERGYRGVRHSSDLTFPLADTSRTADRSTQGMGVSAVSAKPIMRRSDRA